MVVRPLVVAPAQVHADLFRRDVRQGVIERLDVHAGDLAEFLEAEIGEEGVAAKGQVGTVDLQHQTRLGHGLVFLTQRIGDGEQIGLIAGIVSVVKIQRDDAGRGGVQECVPGLSQRRLQVGHVGLGRLRVAHAYRAIAARRPAPRAPGIVEHPLGERGEIDQVLVGERLAGAAEPVQPILDVGHVARLAHLTVADDVDIGVGLLADDLRHRLADAGLERRPINRRAFLLGEHHLNQVVGSGQAAGMRCQKAFGATNHDLLRGRFSCRKP